MRKKIKPLLILTLVMTWTILLSGCQVFQYFQEPTPVAVSGSILFQDDFSNLKSGWNTWNKNDSLVAYQAGGLRIFVNEPEIDYWSRPKYSFDDTMINVDAVKIGGPDNNQYGVICRYQDEANFYGFLISSDGYAGIIKVFEGNYQMISGKMLAYQDAIIQGDALNYLRADCNQSDLTFYINGTKVLEAQDNSFTSGDVGLIAGTYEETGVDIFFDNFIVYKP